MDKRVNNGGHKTAGRKPKAEELKLIEFGISAIKEVYGSVEEYWKHIAKKSKDSYPHLKLLQEYIYGKPKERVDITTNEESLNIPIIKFGGQDNI